MKKYGFNRLVHFVNVDEENRNTFFTPIKLAYDFWLYAYSDHFDVDINKGVLVNLATPHLPGFGDMDKYYEDVENNIEALGDAWTKELTELNIKGKVHLGGAVLKGYVTIESEYIGVVDLNQHKNLFAQTKEGRIILAFSLVWGAVALLLAAKYGLLLKP